VEQARCGMAQHTRCSVGRCARRIGAYILARVPEAVQMEFVVGWLHSRAGHKLECQLESCSMFKEGLGRLIGEMMEQIWVRH
jgi:hypothetical protein